MPDGYIVNDKNRNVFDTKGFDLDGVVAELISTSYFALNGSNLLTIHHTTYVCDFDEYGFIDSQFQRLKSWCDNNEYNAGIIHCIILS